MIKQAYLAGGCFWGMEKHLRELHGVIDTQVGYMGGQNSAPTYEQVCQGNTGHAEVVCVTYDESQLSFKQLIRYFFRMHDPTTLNRQGGDIGSQYRSAIFTSDESEKIIISGLISQIDNSQVFRGKIVTSIEPSEKFYEAEAYHQDYLEKNPNGYNCHLLRDDFSFD
jgi:methionine-S-sulfoxide reductase